MRAQSPDPRCRHMLELPDGPPADDDPPHEGVCPECGHWHSADVRVRQVEHLADPEDTNSDRWLVPEPYLHAFSFRDDL